MRLVHFMTLRLLAVASIVLGLWAVVFYYAIVEEINDEQDDSLEGHAELVIRRFLRGEELPSKSIGSNNQYFMRPVSKEYATKNKRVRYLDHDVYIEEKREYEPARSLYYIFNDNMDNYHELVVSVPTIDKHDLKEALLWLVLSLYGGIIVAFGLISLMTVKRTMSPLRRLQIWMDNYKPGQKNDKLDIKTPIHEFSHLNSSVSQLIERSESYEEKQQLFISNASHEMQTPLAISTGRLESLLEDDSLSEEQLEEIFKTLSALRGLSYLNKSLLMLSRIDNGQYADDKDIDLSEMIAQHLPDYKELFKSKNIETETENIAPFKLRMDEHLAKILLTNLLKNAFVHTEEHGRIMVTSNSKSLTISNLAANGALDADKIFIPFYHTPGKKSSTGLGLPLAMAVCRRYKLDLSYSHSGGMHHFRVSKKM